MARDRFPSQLMTAAAHGGGIDAPTTTVPKFPDVKVKLVGEDGNAFAILGRVLGAMQRAGVPASERVAFVNEAKAGDYDHLLATVMQWVSVR